jgi:tetratricopeptide (TPR) repeat protein
MPRATADDIAHEQVTDHRIPRIPRSPAAKEQAVSGSDAGALVAIGTAAGVAGESSGRDRGVAYALEALRGDQAAGERAMELLREAEALPGSNGDWELHERLGFLDQLAGDKDAAAREYELALAANAYDSVAAGDLALLKAGDRQYAAAIELLGRAFQEDPVQLKAGMNLAIMQCGLGKKEAALGTLDRILVFSPDYGQARDFAQEIRSGRNGCASR